MSKADDVFMRRFAMVLLFLVGFMFFAIIMARTIGSNTEQTMLAEDKSAIEHRIEPVGQVYIAGQTPAPPSQAPAAATPPPAAAPASGGSNGNALGKKIVGQICSACHMTGVTGAPKIGNKAEWGKRLSQQGFATLVKSAISGIKAKPPYGTMPPKGGDPALTKADIEAAIKYMLGKSGLKPN